MSPPPLVHPLAPLVHPIGPFKTGVGALHRCLGIFAFPRRRLCFMRAKSCGECLDWWLTALEGQILIGDYLLLSVVICVFAKTLH